MALAYLAGNKITGLSTDAKPTTIPTGSKFVETDTRLEWLFDGTYWLRTTGQWFPKGATQVTVGNLAAAANSAAYGTNTSAVGGTGGIHGTTDQMDSGAVINTLSGFRWTTYISRNYNPALKFSFKLGQTTNTRLYIGWNSSTGGNPTTQSDQLNAKSGVALWLDTAVSANLQIAHNSGSGASTNDSTAIACSSANVVTVKLVGLDGAAKFRWAIKDGAAAETAYADVASPIPAQTTALGILCYIENLDANSRTCIVYNLEAGVSSTV